MQVGILELVCVELDLKLSMLNFFLMTQFAYIFGIIFYSFHQFLEIPKFSAWIISGILTPKGPRTHAGPRGVLQRGLSLFIDILS